jgi:hypothetical protein
VGPPARDRASVPSEARMADPLPPDASTPRWVKVAGIIGIVAIAVIVVALLIGRHNGPSRHGSPAGAAEVLARR